VLRARATRAQRAKTIAMKLVALALAAMVALGCHHDAELRVPSRARHRRKNRRARRSAT
jgi:hypothetical protein